MGKDITDLTLITETQYLDIQKLSMGAGWVYRQMPVVDVIDWILETYDVDCATFPSWNCDGRIYFALITSIYKNHWFFAYIDDEEFSEQAAIMGIVMHKIFKTKAEALTAALDFAIEHIKTR